MAVSTLTIAGSTIARPASKLILNRWTLSLDAPCELEFTELACDLPGSFAPEAAVTLSISGTVVFNGWIFSRHENGFTRQSGTVGYRCLDLKYRCYMLPITAADGTGTMAFNLPSSSLGYQSTAAGLSVGTILSRLFAQHSTVLSAIGVSTDATTATQLATLTVVPPDPVYLSGNRLWSQVDQLCQQWYGSKIAIVITGAGLIRVVDTTALTAQTLTFGTDKIVLDSIQEDTSECYTAVIVRGRSNVDGAYLSLGEGTLIDPNNAVGTNLEATWSMADFLTPKNASSTGVVNSSTSTTITITSDSGAETWGVNYWSGIQAQITALDAASTAVTGQETHRIISNTALTAGGTSVLTVDVPFAGTGFTRYSIRGQPAGKSECYRRLNIKNTYVAQHLVPQFNFAMKWSPSGFGVAQTWFPVGVIAGIAAGVTYEFPMLFEIIPYDGTTNGYVRCYRPWVEPINTNAALAAGGGAVIQPTNIKVLLPFSRGTMVAVYPSSGFSGTAFSRFNVQRTLTRDYQTWWDQGSTAAMTTLAQQIHATVSNAVIEGQITYVGQYLTAMVPGAPIALNLAHESKTTSYEAMAAPCRTVTMEWPQQGAESWITHLQFSTRRQMFSGDRLYVHPSFSAGGFLSGKGFFGMKGFTVDDKGIHTGGFSGTDARFGGAAMTGDVAMAGAMATAGQARNTIPTVAIPTGDQAMGALAAQFVNPDIAVGQTFNPQEQQAAQRMQGAEQRAQGVMAAAEKDVRPIDAALKVSNRELNAAEDVFAPGQRQKREAEKAHKARVEEILATDFDQPGFEAER